MDIYSNLYKGRPFTIAMTNLGFYCAYVDVTGTSFAGKNYEELNIVCHGRLTFSGVRSFNGEERQCIGWDCTHESDYVGPEYTLTEVINECIAVIDQIIALTA